MFIIYLRIILHNPCSGDLLSVVVKLKAKCKCSHGRHFLVYILQKCTLTKVANFSWSSVTLQKFRTLVLSEQLSANIKLTICKARIRTFMTCACLAWKFAADNRLLKRSVSKTMFSSSLATFRGARRLANFM